MEVQKMKTTLVLVPFLLIATLAGAQDQAPELVTLKFAKGQPVTEILDAMAVQTGRKLVYDPNDQRLRNQTAGMDFSHTIPKARLFDLCTAVLSFFELTVAPVGPKGYEVYVVAGSRSTNMLLKNRAEFVDHQRINEYADRHGKMITTVLPIRNMDNLAQLRTAFSVLVTPAGIGRVMEVRDAKALIVTDFAPNVAVMARIAAQIDTERDDQRVLMRSIELKFAKADEMAATIMRLLETPQAPAVVKSRMPAAKSLRARVVAYAPRNAIARIEG